MMAVSVLSGNALDITVAQGWTNDWILPNGSSSEFECEYGYNLLAFDHLDNKDGEYSKIWNKLLIAKRRPSSVNSPLEGNAIFPDGVVINGDTYMVLALGNILDYANVHDLKLPYEMRFVMDDALTNARQRWLEDLRLPPAMARLGRNSFSGVPWLVSLTMQSPFPPVCVLSDNREVTAGDELAGAAGPFPKFTNGCTLRVPAGTSFFYRSHPCFSTDVFSEIKEISMEEVWPVYEQTMQFYLSGSNPCKLGYIGNAELVLLEMEDEKYIQDGEEMGYEYRVGGFRCNIVGIGAAACKGTRHTKVILPETARFVCDEAFRASSLTELTIPESCRFAGYKAFADCKSLKTVTIMTKETPVFAPDAFDGIAADATLVTYAPVDRNAAPWNAFARIDDRSGVTQIPAEAAGTDTLYDLSGLPVANPLPGTIYVRDGAKVIFR